MGVCMWVWVIIDNKGTGFCETEVTGSFNCVNVCARELTTGVLYRNSRHCSLQSHVFRSYIHIFDHKWDIKLSLMWMIGIHYQTWRRVGELEHFIYVRHGTWSKIKMSMVVECFVCQISISIEGRHQVLTDESRWWGLEEEWRQQGAFQRMVHTLK